MTFWENTRSKIKAVLQATLGLFLFICADYTVYSVFLALNIDHDIYRGAFTVIVNILTAAFMLLIHFTSSTKEKPLIKFKKVSPGQSVALVIIGLGMLGFVTFYIVMADKIALYLESMKEAMVDYRESVDRYTETPQIVVPLWDSILYAVTVSFFVPVAEELCFRGIVFGQLRKAFGPWTSVLLSAVGFGLLHGLSVHIGYALICGVIIAACYHLTDSIIAPVILHTIFNIFGSGIANILNLDCFNIPENITVPVLSGINTASLMFMPLAVLAFAYLVNTKRKIEKDTDPHSEELSGLNEEMVEEDNGTGPEETSEMTGCAEIGGQR